MVFFIFMAVISSEAWANAKPNALRLAVDSYNSLGSSGRLFAFMKLGASPNETRELSDRSGRLNDSKLPKAFLAGASVYFRGIEEPLKVVDLRRGIFTFGNKKLDLRSGHSLHSRLEFLESSNPRRRSSWLMIDWFMPQAFADGAQDPLAAPAVLALAGLSASHQCFNEQKKDCSKQFMGLLAAMGQMGTPLPSEPPVRAFCMPNERGSPRFVVSSSRRTLFAITRTRNDLWLERRETREIPESVMAAEELLAKCGHAQQMENLNIALSHSATSSREISGISSAFPKTVTPEEVASPASFEVREVPQAQSDAEEQGTASMR